MPKVTCMFEEAETTLKEINRLCPWEAERKNEVFKKFKDLMLGKKTDDQKTDSFENIKKWITATETVCPDTVKMCANLRKLLGVGAGIKCGGT